METANPYRPPASPTSDAIPDSRLSFLASLVPATLAIGLTLLLWVVLVSFFDGLVEHRFLIVLWSLTLFLSSSISIVAINRIWRTLPKPLAFGLAFACFGIVFALAEGDTSNGTNYWNMTFVYGTLLSLPVAMYFLARYTSDNRRAASRPRTGG